VVSLDILISAIVENILYTENDYLSNEKVSYLKITVAVRTLEADSRVSNSTPVMEIGWQ
jgi:hypothetical protein